LARGFETSCKAAGGEAGYLTPRPAFINVLRTGATA